MADRRPVPILSSLLARSSLAPALLGVSALASAQSFSTADVQLLHGKGWDLGEDPRTVLTFEYANVWKYGDNFFFADATQPQGKETQVYAEWSPRLSIGRMTGTSLALGPVRDVLLAGTFEFGEHVTTHLFGVGADFTIPSFKVAQLNVYSRDSKQLHGSTWQVTASWLAEWPVGPTVVQFSGFADWAGHEDVSRRNLQTQPQLLVDVGRFWSLENRIWLGIEYLYWRREFGIDGVNESVPQAMLKWVLS